MRAQRDFKAPVHTVDELRAALDEADNLVDEEHFTEAERCALLPAMFNALIHSQVQFTIVQGDGVLLDGRAK